MRFLMIFVALCLTGCGDNGETAAMAEEAWASARSANARADELQMKVEELEERIAYLEAETL
jgi:uncharacterized protein YceH (UPF0502 family)